MSPPGKLIQFYNCSILRDSKIMREDLWVRNSKIINPEPVFYDEKVMADIKIDCGNNLIVPGFIDLQINGGFGCDFSTPKEDISVSVNKVANGILQYGVTSFCPTLITSTPDKYHEIIPKIRVQNGGKHGAGVLGIHVEGPFINKEKRGAHPIQYVKSLKSGIEEVIQTYGTLYNIRIITLAPELDPEGEVIKELFRQGITVSLGHSACSLSDGLVLVTDAMSAMGLQPGTYNIGDQKVEVTNSCAVLSGTQTLSGSIATMDSCVRFLLKSVKCATLHPAQVLGITHSKGTLDFGTDADFVMLK
ncbi:N-acetylglucosamine-6-phosphate deacetylase like protein [Argiope bruennichi]|uniref:N-acetylglucosamine-6-phosphate deacetylase like protein n=1 Tax=Argiope bruennichi TaxID=94029 RepID=A0A8T0E0F8_ARGBR|nr:N-acetylglucosamine-6-phosphate deacetylase like protein [Argiope bruennichi]